MLSIGKTHICIIGAGAVGVVGRQRAAVLADGVGGLGAGAAGAGAAVVATTALPVAGGAPAKSIAAKTPGCAVTQSVPSKTSGAAFPFLNVNLSSALMEGSSVGSIAEMCE